MGIGAGAGAAIAAGVSAAGSIGGSLLSSSAASSASKSAAQQQQQASEEALADQNAQWNYSQAQETPYIENGDNAQTIQNQLIGTYGSQVTPYFNALTNLGSGTTGQATLEQTPGYQFTLAQGLKSTQNAAAARGLGVSGAALKGAASYATGLANNTYQQQYADASNNLTQAQNTWSGLYNALGTQATLGGNVSVQAGTQSQAASNNTSNLLTGAGNAAAAGTIGSANATSSGITGATNALTSGIQNYQTNQLLQQYMGNSGSQYGSSTGTTGVGVQAGPGAYY